jgi:predicted Zn-dependent protease
MKSRIEYFEKMLARDPDNPTGLLALANEYRKAGRQEDVARVLRHYLNNHDDEGNAYARLGDALVELGREDEARQVYERGIEQALRHDHGEMAEEMRFALEQLE